MIVFHKETLLGNSLEINNSSWTPLQSQEKEMLKSHTLTTAVIINEHLWEILINCFIISDSIFRFLCNNFIKNQPTGLLEETIQICKSFCYFLSIELESFFYSLKIASILFAQILKKNWNLYFIKHPNNDFKCSASILSILVKLLLLNVLE